MCGFAGLFDLRGQRDINRAVVERMADAIRHRGPEEDGVFTEKAITIAHRRLKILGLSDGQQPIYNEDRSVAVICNGEQFNYPEQRTWLEAKGHKFRTGSDSEIIVHLYEEYGEDFFERLSGQFSFALYDIRERKLILGRDRTGICPLHWSRQGDWLYFGSEIKALLASGHVSPAIDPRGLDHIFTFFAMSRRRTMFENVQSILPGHYLRITLRTDGKPAEIVERRYWDLDFPDCGDEDNPSDEEALVDEFEATFRRAVEIRLRADVPVVGYLSGGIDSAAVMAEAARITGHSIPSFTIKVPKAGLDESSNALVTARHIGTRPTIVEAGPELIAKVYPDLVSAADCPVMDTSCAALHALSGAVHDAGYKVALTGEGSDEALAGYVWFKIGMMTRALGLGVFQPGVPISRLVRKAATPSVTFAELARNDAMMGGVQAQSPIWHLVSTSRHKFYSREFMDRLDGHVAYEDLDFDTDRIRRWHPLNQSLYVGYKVMLAGLLLNHKGDRVTMANSVETRYPFLDENIIKLTSRLHPRWKLRGFLTDKYLLRQTAKRWLPDEIALRPKAMFRVPFAESFLENAPPYVDQLMSEESLKKTGYFDVAAVRAFYEASLAGRVKTWQIFSSMGMSGVLSTQLWHHQNLGGGLCELPFRNFAAAMLPPCVGEEAVGVR
jgi:asparagine synthase (glutamine-hydrolysing)